MIQETEFKNGDMILDGKYQVEALVGEGEFTRVYRVLHLELGEVRALKITSRGTPGLTKTVLDQYRERFRLEVQFGARLSKQENPHILKVYDFGEVEDQLYLEMEYAAGGNLQDMIDAGPLPIGEATRIALEAAEGLETLHRASAVHRNVKPSNILFDAAGATKIADWGLAQVPKRRSVQQDQDSRSAMHSGTPEYMSPEQALTAVYLTPSSDVYSLGCVLFEMLTGRLWQDAMVMIESPRELRPEISPGLEGVLWKMLRKKPGQQKADAADPNKRYVTMDAARVGLLGVLFDEALDATNLGRWTEAEEMLEQVLLRDPDYERDGRRANIVQANVRRHLAQAKLKTQPAPPRVQAPPPVPPRYAKPVEPQPPRYAEPVEPEPPRYAEAVEPEPIAGDAELSWADDTLDLVEDEFVDETFDLPEEDLVSPIAATQEMEALEVEPSLSRPSLQHTVPIAEVEPAPVRAARPAPASTEPPSTPEKRGPLSRGAVLRLVGLLVAFLLLCVVTTPAVSLWAFNTLQEEYQVVLLPGLFGEPATATATPFTPSPTATPTLVPTETHTPAPTATPTSTVTPVPLEIGMPLTTTSAITMTVAGSDAITATGSITDSTFITTTEVITASKGLTDTERLIMKKTVINTDNFTGTVSVGVAWVRMGPSPNFKAVAKQGEGDLLALLGRNEDSTWLKIRMQDEEEGWIDSRYVDTTAPIDLLTPAESPPTPTPQPTQPPTNTPVPEVTEAPALPEATPTPAMKYPAPVVVGPPDGMDWPDGETAVHYLEWESLNIAPDEFYNVTFIYTKHGETQYFGTNTVDFQYRLPSTIFLLEADRGDFQWRVVVRQNTTGQRGKFDGPPISPESDLHTFTWR